MPRYYTQSGCYPDPTKACFTVSGPQAADQIPQEVRNLLDRPGVVQVDVRFDHGRGERVTVYTKLEGE